MTAKKFLRHQYDNCRCGYWKKINQILQDIQFLIVSLVSICFTEKWGRVTSESDFFFKSPEPRFVIFTFYRWSDVDCAFSALMQLLLFIHDFLTAPYDFPDFTAYFDLL